MSRFALRLPLSVITERGQGGEVNARSLNWFHHQWVWAGFPLSVLTAGD